MKMLRPIDTTEEQCKFAWEKHGLHLRSRYVLQARPREIESDRIHPLRIDEGYVSDLDSVDVGVSDDDVAVVVVVVAVQAGVDGVPCRKGQID